MKVAVPPKKVKSALSKVSKNKVSKKREKDGLGKKKGAVLALAEESLTTPEKKIIAKSLKMKKPAEPAKASENYEAKSSLVSKSPKKPTGVSKSPVVAKPRRSKKKNVAASVSPKKGTVPKSNGANSPVATKSLKKANVVAKSPVVKSVKTSKKQKMNVVPKSEEMKNENSPAVDVVPMSAVATVRKNNKQKDKLSMTSPKEKVLLAGKQKRKAVAESPGIKEKSAENVAVKSLKISKKTPGSLVQKKTRGRKRKQNVVAVSSIIRTKKLRLKKKTHSKLVADSSVELKSELLQGVCASALKLINKTDEGQGKKDLFESLGQPVYFQLTLFKVPETPKKDFRIPVPHSIYPTDPDVLLIVPDIRRGRFRDVTFAKYMEEYEEKLSDAGIKGVKQIIPFTQLRAENNQFELKRRLVHSYDIIACDARLSDHCTHFLGPALKKCNKHVTPLKVTVDDDSHSKRRNFQFCSDLQQRLDMARLKAVFTLTGAGTSLGINLGHSLFSPEQLADNVQAVWAFLGKHLPGGLKNIKTAYLKGAKTLPVPVYASLVPLKKLPAVKPKKSVHPVEDEISTLPGFTTIVDSSGNVKVVNRQTAEDREFFKTVFEPKESNKRSKSQHGSKSKRIKKNDDDNDDVDDDEENDISEDDGEDDLQEMMDTAAAEEEYLKNWAESAAEMEKEQKNNQGKTKSRRKNKNKKGSE
ncbi:ribosomal L1 domain-containing protein CG13096-like [Thrips palmi]|uniref:Ribosomal L1 domain-containing protein CG13096-like n=1 Tax=Thrips palmi TaxID=161013 RepID=A0A6P8YRR9_THRPL|nr:ribosomal L1 domain-containing protein CG13096-like [Thrips palmi]XP_034242723.1 ribosomal L1 domain-containing protein CG13096-like [Thrips palmi]